MQADKTYQISEVRLRFPAPADIPQLTLLLYIAKDLQKSIANLTKFRDYHLIPVVPRKKDFGRKKPCCDQMRQRVGTPLKMVIQPAEFQGDTDDAVSGSILGNESERLYVDNKIDWVIIQHFWVPTILVNTEGEREESQAAYKAGAFAKWEEMPDAWPVLRERFFNNGD